MDQRLRGEVIDLFKAASQRGRPMSARPARLGAGAVATDVSGSGNTVTINVQATERHGGRSDAAERRRLIAIVLRHTEGIEARQLLADFLRREYGTELLRDLSDPELRAAHRTVLQWTSPIG